MKKKPTVTINIPAAVRDRLAALAEVRGTTIGDLVMELARTALTPAERAERANQTRAYLAEHFGYQVTAEDEINLNSELDGLFPARDGGAASA